MERKTEDFGKIKKSITLTDEQSQKVKDISDELNEYFVTHGTTILTSGAMLSALIAIQAEILHTYTGQDKPQFIKFVTEGAQNAKVSIIRTANK